MRRVGGVGEGAARLPVREKIKFGGEDGAGRRTGRCLCCPLQSVVPTPPSHPKASIQVRLDPTYQPLPLSPIPSPAAPFTHVQFDSTSFLRTLAAALAE